MLSNPFYFLKSVIPNTPNITTRARKIKKIIFAIDAAPSAIPLNPKIAATIAIIKNMADHLSIVDVLSVNN